MCSPLRKRELCPKRNQQDRRHWCAFAIRPFLFWVFTPECEGKIRTKRGFCAPQRECVPQVKIVPEKKATGPIPLGCICEEDRFFFFWSSPSNVRAKSVPKKAFASPSENVPTKQKLFPKKKKQDLRHWDAFAIKTFFWFSIPNIFLCLTEIVSAIPPSTLL